MSRFKVGDRVTVTTPRGSYAKPLLGHEGVVTRADAAAGGVDITFEPPMRVYFLFDDEIELAPQDWEAKYNDLVADLIAAYRQSDATLGAFVKTNLMPKPKEYDVTLRVPEEDGRAAKVTGGTFRGFPVVKVVEVTP